MGQVLRGVKVELQRSHHPAVYCTASFGFFRLGGLLLLSRDAFSPRLHLAWGDVAVDDVRRPRMVRCRLKQSKTDQLGRGVNAGRTESYAQLAPCWHT